jgi:LPS-assembly lipoprotein
MASSARWHRPAGVALALLLLAGCGFRPLYGSGSIVRDRGEPGTVSLSEVQIEPIPNRRGQELRNRLIDRFYGDGRPASPTYALAVTNLRTSITKLGIQKNATATTALLDMTATYRLTDAQTRATIDSGTSRSIVRYNILTSPFATLAAENDAYERAIQDISEDLTSRIAVTLHTRQQELAAH